MCYVTRDDSGIKTAKRDIPVLKLCYIKKIPGVDDYKLHGYYRERYVYDRSGKIVAEPKANLESVCGSIDYGFHFRSSLDVYDSGEAVAYCLFWIPKGAQYRYSSRDEEYISTHYKFGEILALSEGTSQTLVNLVMGTSPVVNTDPEAYDGDEQLTQAIKRYLKSKRINLKDA